MKAEYVTVCDDGDVIAFVACAPWGEYPRSHKVRVEQDGTLRVFDRVAGHYTIHHGLPMADVDAIVATVRHATTVAS